MPPARTKTTPSALGRLISAPAPKNPRASKRSPKSSCEAMTRESARATPPCPATKAIPPRINAPRRPEASEYISARDVSSGLAVKSVITSPTAPVARPEMVMNAAGPSALWAAALKFVWVATDKPTSTAITTAYRKRYPLTDYGEPQPSLKDIRVGGSRAWPLQAVDLCLASVPVAVEACLVERTPDELQPDGQPRAGEAARDGEARETVEVGRPRQPGQRREHELFVTLNLYLSLTYLGGRHGDGRRQEHIHLSQSALELFQRAALRYLLRLRVAVSLQMLCVADTLAGLVTELLRLALQTLLVDGVGLDGEDDPLRFERLRKVRDLDLTYFHS